MAVAQDIAAELELFGLSALDALIAETRDGLAPIPFGKRRPPSERLDVYLVDALLEVRQAAEKVITKIAADEAERLALEEDEAA